MAKLTLLGTGSALSGPDRENTYLLLQGARTNILIDCAGSPAQRLARVGVTPAEIDHLILTHSHPDHIYGLSVFMLNAWMTGRQAPLHIYGLAETLRGARLMLRAVEAQEWPQFFKIQYHVIPRSSPATVLEQEAFSIITMPAVHFVPTMSLRITDAVSGARVMYTADTAPSENIITLAEGAKYLLHEATLLDGSDKGHSSAIQAGEAAARARVQELILVHLPPQVQPNQWHEAASRTFAGTVRVAADFDSFEF